MAKGDKKKVDGNLIYFYTKNETFVFNINKNKIDSCTSDLSKFKLDDPQDLQKKAYEFYREKKLIEEKKMNLKNPIPYPVDDFSPYFKVYVLENTKTLKKYEVDWIYSSF